ncbi:MAG: YceI family protein [Candidatus Marinimicrobia bacterium]|nr:YceI family protein [Candidatus Neomarinimicrobiota bacterium]MCF7903956.1 YceI family protein [Candidatus Neomarinimicrobiota bacterium]
MKRTKNIMSALLLLLISVGLNGQSQVLRVDTENSIIEWMGSKVTGRHTGVIDLQEGLVEFENDRITGGRFTFDMRSIENTDMPPGERRQKLETHLKAADFFDVAKYPTAVFRVISATPSRLGLPGETIYQISGDLTIKGITHVVNFEAIVNLTDKMATAKGDIVVDRTRYNMKYRSGSVFDGLGDRMIHDDFKVSFNLTTK